MAVRLAQEALVGDDARDGALQVVELDGDLIGVLALREPDRVSAQL